MNFKYRFFLADGVTLDSFNHNDNTENDNDPEVKVIRKNDSGVDSETYRRCFH